MAQKILIFSAISCVFFALGADAQVNPVRLRVLKQQKTDYRQSYQTTDGYWRERRGTKAVSYSIAVANNTTKPLMDVRVEWAVLVQPYVRYDQLRVVDGSKSVDIPFGKSFVFETDIIELTGYEWRTSEGGRHQHSAEILGYAVEVYIGDKLVASDIKPSDAKRKIEQVSGRSEQRRQRY
jgi:hypothetical protein